MVEAEPEAGAPETIASRDGPAESEAPAASDGDVSHDADAGSAPPEIPAAVVQQQERAADPGRDADWRFREVIRRAGRAADRRGSGEPLIRCTTNYVRGQQARTQAERTRVAARFPTIAQAFQIRFDARQDCRIHLEALALASFSTDTIATRLALPQSVIVVYLLLFLDVLDRLHCPDFICTRVIGLPHPEDCPQTLQRKTLLYVGWLAGLDAVNALLLPGVQLGSPGRAEDVPEYLQALGQATAAHWQALAPLLDRLDRGQSRHFTRMLAKASQTQAVAAGERGYRDYLRNVEACFEQIDLSFGSAGIPSGSTEKYYRTNVEPRASQWEAISRGEATPELDRRIEEWQRMGPEMEHTERPPQAASAEAEQDRKDHA